MAIALTALILSAAATALAAPEAAITSLTYLVAGLGIAWHAALPPPAEDTIEAILLRALVAM